MHPVTVKSVLRGELHFQLQNADNRDAAMLNNAVLQPHEILLKSLKLLNRYA